MRVLHFYRTYSQSYGGIEQVIYQLCVGTQQLGVTPEVLTLSRDASAAEIDIDGHRVVRAPLDLEIASTGFSRAVFARFREQAAAADLIHYHFPWPFMDVVHFACGVPRMAMLKPADEIDVRMALSAAFQRQPPVALPYPRGAGSGGASQPGLPTML